MTMAHIDTGIRAILFYSVLKRKDAENMLADNDFSPAVYNPLVDSYKYVNKRYAGNGVVFTVSKFNDSPWGLYVYMYPSRVLQDYGPYQPGEESYKALAKTVDKMLSAVKSPCKLQDMKISNVTVSADQRFSKKRKVNQYLAIIKQAFVPRHYDVVPFPEQKLLPDENHIYCQSCNTTIFLACGSPVRENTLHLELSLRRRAIRRKVGKKALKSQYKTLVQLSRKTGEMMVDQFKRMKLLADSYVSYDQAVRAIDRVKDKDTRKRMKYLLEQTRSLGNLALAIDELKQQYSLGKRQANRVLKKFAKLGISPVMVEGSGKKGLPGLGVILKEIYK